MIMSMCLTSASFGSFRIRSALRSFVSSLASLSAHSSSHEITTLMQGNV